MKSHSTRRRALGVLTFLLAGLGAACDSTSPLALAGGPVVLEGRIASVTEPTPALSSGGSALAGIEVSVEGSTATTTTDSTGTFRLELEAGENTIVLHFRRGPLDASIELQGVSPGTIIRVEFSLDVNGGTVTHRRDDRHDEFEGTAALVSLVGTEPSRTLRIALNGDSTSVVDIIEGETRFEADGDILTFAALLVAVDSAGPTIRVEGDGALEGGVTIATSVKVETDDHDDDSDDDRGGSGGHRDGSEFRGLATLLSVSGLAPDRIVRVRVTDDEGVRVAELLEGEVRFDDSGDLHSVIAVLAALGAVGVIRLEGEGVVGADGVILATAVRAELD